MYLRTFLSRSIIQCGSARRARARAADHIQSPAYPTSERAADCILVDVNRAAGSGTSRRSTMKESPIRLGLIADQTGPLSSVGAADVNLAKLVVEDINVRGGLLRRRLELLVEDSATIDSV